MIDIGRVCVKTAGRDAGQTCVVINVVDNNFVEVDGNTRRKKCNIMHLEPMNTTLDIKKGASFEDVQKAFEKAGLEITKTLSEKKEKKAPAKKAEPKTAKKATKKEE